MRLFLTSGRNLMSREPRLIHAKLTVVLQGLVCFSGFDSHMKWHILVQRLATSVLTNRVAANFETIHERAWYDCVASLLKCEDRGCRACL